MLFLKSILIMRCEYAKKNSLSRSRQRLTTKKRCPTRMQYCLRTGQNSRLFTKPTTHSQKMPGLFGTLHTAEHLRQNGPGKIHFFQSRIAAQRKTNERIREHLIQSQRGNDMRRLQ